MQIKDFIRQYDYKCNDLVISDIGSSFDAHAWRNDNFEGKFMGMIRIVDGQIIVLEKKDNEPRKAGAFVSTKDGVVPYSEFSRDKHVVTVANRKRDFIERAAIEIYCTRISKDFIYDDIGAVEHAKNLWNTLQKEFDDGKNSTMENKKRELPGISVYIHPKQGICTTMTAILAGSDRGRALTLEQLKEFAWNWQTVVLEEGGDHHNFEKLWEQEYGTK